MSTITFSSDGRNSPFRGHRVEAARPSWNTPLRATDSGAAWVTWCACGLGGATPPIAYQAWGETVFTSMLHEHPRTPGTALSFLARQPSGCLSGDRPVLARVGLSKERRTSDIYYLPGVSLLGEQSRSGSRLDVEFAGLLRVLLRGCGRAVGIALSDGSDQLLLPAGREQWRSGGGVGDSGEEPEGGADPINTRRGDRAAMLIDLKNSQFAEDRASGSSMQSR